MRIKLCLLGPFTMTCDGTVIDVPASGARILAYLALRHHAPVSRIELADLIWGSVERRRALGNLRSAMWRLPRAARAAVRETGCSLALRPEANVDLDAEDGAPAPRPGCGSAPRVLLADWYDDWVLAERERRAMGEVVALERSTAELLRQDRVSEALLTALAAVEHEPLREAPHRLVIACHVANGNLHEALRHYADLERLLDAELGVAPSPATRRCLPCSPLPMGAS